MPKILGRKVNVGIGKETVRGTAVIPTFWIPKISFDHDDKVEKVVDESSVGVIEDSVQAKIVKQWAEGSLEGKISDQSFGLLLLSLLGSVNSVQDGATAVYKHTFSVNQTSQHQSLTVGMDDEVQDYQFVRAMLQSLEVNVELGAFCRFVTSFMSKKGTTATLTPSYTAENEFLPQHGEFKLANDLAGLDVATPIKMKSFVLTVEKNVETDDVIGNVEPDDILNKQLMVSGSVELLYENTDQRDLFTSDTVKALRLLLKDPNVTLDAGAANPNPFLQIDLAKTSITEWSRNNANDDIVRQTLGFKGFYSLSDAKMIEMVLNNKQVSY